MDHKNGNVSPPDQQLTHASGTYSISLSPNGWPLWTPAKGSKELSEALKIHFPEKHSTKDRMIAALDKFNRDRSLTPQGSSQPAAETMMNGSRNLQDASPDLSQISPKNEATVLPAHENGPNTTRNGQAKTESAQNRGMVCDYHRQNHAKCDPKTCPKNKRYHQPSNHRKSSSNASCKSLSPGETSLAFGSPGASAATPRSCPGVRVVFGQLRADFCEQGEHYLTPGPSEVHYSPDNRQASAGQASEDDEHGSGSSGRSNGGSSDDRYRYGEYGRPYDEDKDNSPFNGAYTAPGGGYPRPNGGGYYSLEDEINSEDNYTFSPRNLVLDFGDTVDSYDYYPSSTYGANGITELEKNIAKISIQ